MKSVPTSDVEADHGTEGASAAVAEVGGGTTSSSTSYNFSSSHAISGRIFDDLMD